jgi:chromosome segregation ATPase
LSSEQGELIKKRLFHLEHEIDGLLKRRIHLSLKDREGGERFLDYTGILNEKENQIIELEKKIQNLEERLRRASQREFELENEIERLKTAILRL